MMGLKVFKEHNTNSIIRRRAYHAGSWYDSCPKTLDKSLSGLIDHAEQDLNNARTEPQTNNNIRKARAIIAPHAGYRFSGPTAAYAYLALREALMEHHSDTDDDNIVTTVVVLHPSHHVYIDNSCAISSCDQIETPLGNLNVDIDLRNELLQLGYFTKMEKHVDEREHSGEMQFPFIAKVANDALGDTAKVRVLPIMVGNLEETKEQLFGQVLAPFLIRDFCLTVVSSDFCHWGSRFQYSPFDSQISSRIFEYIEWLDRGGMEHISMQDPGAFAVYLKEYRNTICGRHPIGVWLHSVQYNRIKGMETLDIEFVRYAQSGQVMDFSDSSVSYASAVATIKAKQQP